jgi:hypothetical protein
MKRMGSPIASSLIAWRTEGEAALVRRWALASAAYKTVDTCAGEFQSATLHLHGSYDEEDEAPRTDVVRWSFGSGPNRTARAWSSTTAAYAR